MYEKIKERYLKNYIRDDQLERYVALGVVTEQQADEMRRAKLDPNGNGEPEGPGNWEATV